MSDKTKKRIDSLLETVKPNRRELLKRLLMSGGVLAALSPASTLLAAQAPPQQPDGSGGPEGNGKGKGKAKGKGGGKGKGRGGRGKGKGKGTEPSSE